MNLGQIVMTRGVNDVMADNAGFAKHVTDSLRRYCNCDWGDLDKDDWAQNDLADGRIFASYKHPTVPSWTVWIITEWDHSYTTIMFPSEY